MDDATFCKELRKLKKQCSTHYSNNKDTKMITSRRMEQINDVIATRIKRRSKRNIFILLITILVALLSVGFSYVMAIPYNATDIELQNDHSLTNQLREYVTSFECILESNQLISEMARPLYNCSHCATLDKIERVKTMSHQEFLVSHAYSTVPIVITGETDDWQALHTFSFDYFKQLYTSREGQLDEVNESCGYFAWNSNIPSLGHVFNMSDERAQLLEGQTPWYIGWANCHMDTSLELRKLYKKPRFLPQDSENIVVDWIFMGWPGMGAYIHLDSVIRPSWQAQISGRKTWTFNPVPECNSICKDKYQITVEKGEIIVFDSNQWYHSTYTEPGDISITIGSEYD